MAKGASGFIDLLPRKRIWRSRWRSHVNHASSRKLHSDRSALRHPVAVGKQSPDRFAVDRWSCSIHGEPETALDTLGERVDLVIFFPISGIHTIGSPKWRRIGFPSPVQMTALTGQVISGIVAGILSGLCEDVLPLPDQIPEGPGRNGSLRRRRKDLLPFRFCPGGCHSSKNNGRE